jgi:ectoine hydroxylase-related dioxygenase (phytanoyl-CoA dioxygenase family)
VRALPSETFEVTVDEAMVAAFHRDGFCSIERITTDAELEWLRDVFDELFAEKRAGIPGGYFDLSRPYDAEGPDHLPQVLFPEIAVPDLRRTQLRRNARRICAALLGVPGSDLQAWGHMIHKPAHHGEQIPWHQDEAYWEPDLEYLAIGTWVPLDDVDLDNGCMCFLPGSHEQDVLPHRHIDDDPNVHGLVTDHADPSRMVPVPLAAGGATFHHSRTLHHTPANRSDRQRRAVATEFQTTPTPRAVPAPRPWVDSGKAAWAARAAPTST